MVPSWSTMPRGAQTPSHHTLGPLRREVTHRSRDPGDDLVERRRAGDAALVDDGPVGIHQRDAEVGAAEVDTEGGGVAHGHPLSLAAALLADHPVGRLDERLGCVEQRVGRFEHVVLHLRDRAQQFGEDALEDRRGR